MASSEWSQSDYRAIVVGDHRCTFSDLDATDSSYTEAGARPGRAAPQQDTEMVIETSGTQSTDGALRVKCVRAGLPGRNNALFVWQQDGDSDWRGCDAPQPVVGWEVVAAAATAGVRGARRPHMITLSDGTIAAVYCSNDGTNSIIKYVTRDPSTDTWGLTPTIYTEASSGSFELHPTLTLLPSGRILIHSYTYDGTNGLAQVQMLFSDDDGANWEVGSKYTLPAPLDTTSETPGRIRAAYSNGQVLLMQTSASTNAIRQYGSVDLGSTFSLIESTAANSETDVIALNSGAFMISDPSASISSGDEIIVIGNAYSPASDGKGTSIGTTPDEIALALDDTGAVYLYEVAGDLMEVQGSYDEGETWTTLGDQFGWAGGFTAGAAVGPENICATFHRGRVVVGHNWSAVTTTYDNSFAVFYMGGYSTVVMPAQTALDAFSTRGHWDIDWVPMDVPGNMGWTPAGVASAESVSGQVLNLHTAAGNTRTYQITATTTTARGYIATYTASVQSGQIAMSLHMDDTNDDYQIEVQMTTTQLILYDVNGASNIATAAISSDTEYQILVGFNETPGAAAANVYCWYREYSSNEDREWTELGNSTAVTRAPGGAGVQWYVTWGVITAGATESEWRHVSFSYDTSTGLQLSEGQTNPDDLFGRPMATVPVYYDDGVWLAAKDGPAFYEDDWHIDAEHDYPVEHLFIGKSPSPNVKWRSTSTADNSFAFSVDTVAAAKWPTNILAVWVDQTNAPYVTIATETTPGGGYSNVYSANLLKTVAYTREGKGLTLTASGTNTLYVEDDELVGCNFAFGTAAGSKIREITRNTAGAISSSTTRAPVLYCDDMDGTEGASGTGYIHYPSGLFLVSLAAAEVASVKVTLGIGGGVVPPEGYLECGTLLVGAAYPLGWQYSATRAITTSPNIELTTDAAGRRKSRVLGPERRSVDLTWTEGVDTSNLFDDIDDYLICSDVAGAIPVAMRSDAPMFLSGIMRHLDYSNTPFLYVPNLPHLSQATTRIYDERAGGCFLCRMVSPLDLQTLWGTEHDTEIVRIAATLDEEV